MSRDIYSTKQINGGYPIKFGRDLPVGFRPTLAFRHRSLIPQCFITVGCVSELRFGAYGRERLMSDLHGVCK